MQQRIPMLVLSACAAGVTGYVLLFYVRSATWPWVGLLLMLLAALLAVVAIARSRRPVGVVLAVLGVVPLAVLVWAVVRFFRTSRGTNSASRRSPRRSCLWGLGRGRHAPVRRPSGKRRSHLEAI